jgi:hypothetical protein
VQADVRGGILGERRQAGGGDGESEDEGGRVSSHEVTEERSTGWRARS